MFSGRLFLQCPFFSSIRPRDKKDKEAKRSELCWMTSSRLHKVLHHLEHSFHLCCIVLKLIGERDKKGRALVVAAGSMQLLMLLLLRKCEWWKRLSFLYGHLKLFHRLLNLVTRYNIGVKRMNSNLKQKFLHYLLISWILLCLMLTLFIWLKNLNRLLPTQ